MPKEMYRVDRIPDSVVQSTTYVTVMTIVEDRNYFYAEGV